MKSFQVSFFRYLLAWGVSVLIGGQLKAAVIANYQGDYLNGTVGQTRPQVSADGWDYMWNSGGPIGTAANYSSLLATGSRYTYDGDNSLPRAEPAAHVYLGSSGGHPGRGSTQNYGGSGNTIDRYAIAAYTVQSGEAGLVQITGSSLSVGSANSNGVELRIYVNDTFVTHYIQPGAGGAGLFNVALGQLNEGDTVYVALGPNTHDGSDGFSLGFQLETVTETASVFWDPDGVSPVGGGTGTWNTTTASWAAGVYGTVPYSVWNNSANKAAYFTGTGGTVTVAEAITVGALSFEGSYTLEGTGSLTLTSGGTGGPGPATIQVVHSTDTVTISAPVASAAGLTKIGQGTLELTGTTTITGGEVSAAGGTLRLAGNSTATIAGNLNVGRNWMGSNPLNGGGSGALVIQDNATLTVANLRVGDASYIAGTVTQTGGTVTITSTCRIGHYPNETSSYTLSGGTLSLTGTPSGNVTIYPEQPGILYLGVDGTGNFTQTGGQASAHGIVLDTRGDTTGTDTLTISGGTFTIGPSGIQSGTNNTNTSYQINLGGSGPTIKASADWASPLNMRLTGGAKNAVRFDTNSYNITLSGNLTGGGDLNKVGDGTLTLAGTANSLGRIYAAGGNLVFATGSATTASSGIQVGANDYFVIGGGSGTATVEDDASLTVAYIIMGDNYGGPTQTNYFYQTGGTVTITRYSQDTLAGLPNKGAMRIGHWPNETSTYSLSGGTLVIQDPEAGILLATDGNGTFHQTGGTANANFVKLNTRPSGYGTGIFTLEGGTFIIGSGGFVTEAGPYEFNLGGAGPTLQAAADWASSLNITLSGTGANAIHFDTNGYTVTLSGVLSGAGGLVKTGPGDLVLSGANTYTGGTTVLAGRLLVNNTTGSGTGTGDVVVQGGLLGGNGTIGGNVLVQAGAALSAGTSPGHLTIQQNYTQQADGTLLVELAGYTQGGTQALPGQWAANGYDWVSVGGQAVLDGYLQIALLAGFQPASGDVFNVLTAAGGIDDQGLDLVWQAGSLLPGQYWTYQIIAGQGAEEILQLQLGVPEPASLVLLILGAAGLLLARRFLAKK